MDSRDQGSRIKVRSYSGAGNTFDLIDDREGICNAHKVKTERDGVILLQESEQADIRMRIYNRDGSEAEMCGNGLRCLHFFAEDLGLKGPFDVETGAALLKTWREGETIACTMPRPFIIEPLIWVEGLPLAWLNTGVPHVVFEVKSVAAVQMDGFGAEFRNNPLFGPEGVNVNVMEVTGEQSAKIRTYERGVEGETEACGTGALACAATLGQEKVTITTKSGAELEFTLHPDIEMRGPVSRLSSPASS